MFIGEREGKPQKCLQSVTHWESKKRCFQQIEFFKCVNVFSVSLTLLTVVTKLITKGDLREEGLSMAYGLRGYSPSGCDGGGAWG